MRKAGITDELLISHVRGAIQASLVQSEIVLNPEQRHSGRVAESQAPSIRDGEAGVTPGRAPVVPDVPSDKPGMATPRTDAAIERGECGPDLCRKLERELAEARSSQSAGGPSQNYIDLFEAAKDAVDEWPASSNTDNPEFEEAMAVLERVVVALERSVPSTGVDGERPCATCNDDPAVCATVPGLRHCEKAMRDATSTAPTSSEHVVVLKADLIHVAHQCRARGMTETAAQLEAMLERVSSVMQSAIAHSKPGYKLIKNSTFDERSWKEDEGQENGRYYCICCACERRFLGHKRRVVCKTCAEEVSPADSRDEAKHG